MRQALQPSRSPRFKKRPGHRYWGQAVCGPMGATRGVGKRAPMSLDLSQKADLVPLAQVVGSLQRVAQAMNVDFFLMGAAARDVMLRHGHNIEPERQTKDVDFAVIVPDWEFAREPDALTGYDELVVRGAMEIPNLGIKMPKLGICQTFQMSSPNASLADALFSTTQQRVLGLLFGQPDRSFYATELIGLAGVGSGGVQRELARLAQSGLVTVRSVGNQKHFQANPDAP